MNEIPTKESLQLDSLLRAYRISVDASEFAVDRMVRAARLKAVRLGDDLTERGFFGLVAYALGFNRQAQAMWSAAAGVALALIIGITLGTSDALPNFDEQAFAIDFDTMIGSSTLSAPITEDLSL